MQTTYITDKAPMSADLGTGAFIVESFSEHQETRISELALLGGGFDRRITGCSMVYTLSGRVLPQDRSFFEALCEAVSGNVIERVSIGTKTLTDLFVPKAELVFPEDSHIGSYTIVLREL